MMLEIVLLLFGFSAYLYFIATTEKKSPAFWPFVVCWGIFFLVEFASKSYSLISDMQSKVVVAEIPQVETGDPEDEMPVEELVKIATLIGNEIVWTGGHKAETCEKYLGSKVRIGFNVQEDTKVVGQDRYNVQTYEIPASDGRGIAMTVIVNIHLDPPIIYGGRIQNRSSQVLKPNTYAEIYGEVIRMQKFGNETFFVDIVTISRSK